MDYVGQTVNYSASSLKDRYPASSIDMSTVVQHGSTATLSNERSSEARIYSKPRGMGPSSLFQNFHIGPFHGKGHELSYSQKRSWLNICTSTYAARLHLTS